MNLEVLRVYCDGGVLREEYLQVVNNRYLRLMFDQFTVG